MNERKLSAKIKAAANQSIKEKEYWLNKLSGDLVKSTFPYDFTGEGTPKAAEPVRFQVKGDTFIKLTGITRGAAPLVHMTLVTGIITLLEKYNFNGDGDSMVGIPIYRQEHSKEFINSALVLRIRVNKRMTFKELLTIVRQTVIEADEHQNYPVELLPESLNIPYSHGNDFPLFDISVLLEDIHAQSYIDHIKHNMMFSFSSKADRLEGSVSYNAAFFRKSTVERTITYFNRILEQALGDMERTLADIRVIPEEEKNRLLEELNKTGVAYPQHLTIHGIFEGQVEKCGNRLAVADGPLHVTYGELNRRADQLAPILQEKGAGPGHIIAMMMEPSAEMIIGIMAILKAGAAYLPIDPQHPKERSEYMLKDSSAKLLLTDTDSTSQLAEGFAVLHMEDAMNCAPATPVQPPFHSPTQPCYVIYTSGTTGKPKGVMIEHRNVVRLFFNDQCLFDFNRYDAWTLFHSYCFDFSVWEMYGALLFGGKLVVFPREVSRDPAAFLHILSQQRVTVLNQTPSAFYSLAAGALASPAGPLYLRYVIFGGEALHPARLADWRQAYPNTRLINMFGITETTVHVTYKEITEEDIRQGISNIGHPIPTLSTLVLDKNLDLLPVGAPGLLYVGGAGVARGYLNRPELTAERFINHKPQKPEASPAHPNCPLIDSTLYNSGDLARVLENGEMEYLGRADFQVQVKGFRVELGEVENRMLEHPLIRDAVVTARHRDDGSHYLCAYYTVSGDKSVTGLREYLALSLPDYMIPSFVTPMDEIPLTVNGKVDRKALPEPVLTIDETYIAPSTEMEVELAGVWQRVLQIEKIGVTDSYFSIGGDSIKAITLINSMNSQLSANLSIADLYQNDSIAKMARLLAPGSTVIENKVDVKAEIAKQLEAEKEKLSAENRLPEGVEDVYPLSDIEKGMVFVSSLNHEGAVYHDQIAHQVSFRDFDKETFNHALYLLMKKHPILRTLFNIDDYPEPLHLVYREIHPDIEHYDISALAADSQEEHIRQYMSADRQQPFQVSRSLWRMRTFALGQNRYFFILMCHHAILDGWSVASFLTELNNIYITLKEQPEFQPGELKSSYKDFVIEQISLKKKTGVMDFWKQELYDYKKLEINGIETSGDKKPIYFSSPTLPDTLSRAARENNTTLKHLFFGAFAYMINMLSYENDVVVGLVANNRPVCEDGDKILGCFLNSVPVRLKIPALVSCPEYIGMIEQKMQQLKEFDRLSLYEIARNLDETPDKNNPIFNALFNFVDFHIFDQAKTGHGVTGGDTRQLAVESFESTSIPLVMTVSLTAGVLNTGFYYKDSPINQQTASRYFGYFRRVLDAFADGPHSMLSRDSVMSPAEKQQLLREFNTTTVDYQKDQTIPQLFSELVEKSGDRCSLVSGRSHLTYGELNRKAGALAAMLQEKGAGPETIVAIKAESSPELIIGLLGILKTGAAFLPIDPQYPQDRIDYMLEDSSAKILLTTDDLESELPATPDRQPEHPAPQPAAVSVGAANTAYIIYTSGSTGRPKGVVVQHRALVNLCCWHNDYYEVNQRDHATKYAGIGFDASVWEIFPYLVKGAVLFVIPDEIKLDVRRLNAYYEKHDITTSFLPTQVCEQFMEIDNRSLRVLLAGGDKLKVFKQRNYRLYNNYGPTENTVVSTAGLVTRPHTNIPIGKPVHNSRIFILNPGHLTLQPIGVPGELCIAGDSLGMGYLNRPELTAEKFTLVKRSFGSFRIYKTGDLARWLPDGNIQFLGRIDQQVKIRGFRIELGEIENRLSAHESVKEAVVTAIKSGIGDRYLCAYVVPGKDLGIEGPGELKDYLAVTLPDYMIPQYFVNLDNIPLNASGKIDYKALPDPGEIPPDETGAYVQPRNPVEKELVRLWESALGRERIGIHDNFFMVGGDSIKSIRIISGMTNAGYKLETRDLFQLPTIAQLSLRVKKPDRIAVQEPVTGNIALTPIQRWFFSRSPVDTHHFNQAIMLFSKEGFGEDAVIEIFSKIHEHHDALRMTYNIEKDRIVQTCRGLDHPLSLQVFDLRNRDNPSEELQEITNAIQAGINLANGPLMKLGLFHLDDGNRLLIVIHHLVIDGVSWRILFEDIETLMQQYKNKEPLALPLKSDPYKVWAEKLMHYADSPAFLKEKEYWAQEVNTPAAPIGKDFANEHTCRKDSHTLTFQLNETETDLLLTRVNQAFGTEINDILLTALALGINRTWGHRRIAIALEGHGREEILDDIDINRTVGWFTSIYPVVLDTSFQQDPARQVKEIKESLRRVPNKGTGYLILGYLTSRQYKQEIELTPEPGIGFNYLGQFDQDVAGMSFKIAAESPGHTMSLERPAERELDVSGFLAGSRLRMSITFNKKQYKTATIETLLSNYHTQLQRLIDFCASQEKQSFSPADFTYKGLTIETVDRLSELYNIQDLYTLTPMQEGMLFHALYSEDSVSYFQQTSFRLTGKLDTPLIEKSLNELFKRHDILRTSFIHEGVDRPIQVVVKERPIDFYFEDLRDRGTPEDKESLVRKFKVNDRKRYFDLSRDPLMRVSMLRLDREAYEFTWSFHHILMDGWCIGIITGEFFEIYNSFLESRNYELPPVYPYSTYIKWLAKQDNEDSRRYWSWYLETYEEAAVIPYMNATTRDVSSENYKKESVSLVMDEDVTNRLKHCAAKNQVTLNTIFMAIWGIILGKYNRTDDVVFGAVVSGRPSGLEGVESIVGLFINTIPVRINFGNEMTFDRLLQKIKEDAVAGERHHYYPLADIQAECMLRQNLVNHILIFENFAVSQKIEGTNSRVSNVEVFEQTNYDFNITIIPGERISIRLDYNQNALSADYAAKITSHIREVARQISDNNVISTSSISLLTKEEKQRILYDFNHTDTPYPAAKTLHQLFSEQAARSGGRISVVSDQLYITYGELDRKADRLASTLREKGAGPGTIVAIKVDRSLQMIIGLLGILKSGAAYLPIDPDYPKERIDYMLKDSSADLLLTTGDISAAFPAARSPQPVTGKVIAANLAYVIYTSGSTGRPKGVMIEHRPLVNFFKGMTGIIDFSEKDTILSLTTISFDIFGLETFLPLTLGAQVVLGGKDEQMDPDRVGRLMEQHGVTIFQATPSRLKLLLASERARSAMKGLKNLLVGGEAFPGLLLQEVREITAATIYNMYGPTETTIWSTVKDVTGGELNIGKPIANTHIFLLDNSGSPTPVGIAGELCIGGHGLARGYINRPELTAERFVHLTLNTRHLTLYRTGDLARWLPDGNIEFLGRIDFQVKIRGFRIEMGEIESLLMKHDSIREAVVVVREAADGDKYLCAYVVTGSDDAGHAPENEALKEFLSQSLPDYMIPSFFVRLDEIPLNTSGKVDRKALPSPEITAGDNYTPPRDTAEITLVEIWSHILGIEQRVIGIDDNFFALGGHSLKATSMVSRTHKELGVKLRLAEVFKTPTIREMGELVRTGVKKVFLSLEPVEKKEYYPPSSVQKRMYFLQQMDAGSTAYHITNVMQLDGQLDKDLLEKVFRRLIARHESLRTSFHTMDGQPVQVVHDTVDFSIERIGPIGPIKDILANFIRPFDLSQAPLIRVGLIKTANNRHVIAVDLHHIAADGTSMAILTREFMALYAGETLPHVELQYKDYSHWQDTPGEKEKIKKQEAFWLEQLGPQTEVPVLNLPTDYRRPAVMSYDGNTIGFTLDDAITSSLKLLGSTGNATLFMVLLAIYDVFLAKLCGQEDIVVGTPTAGREHTDLEPVVGMFVNTLPLRNAPAGEKTFNAFLEEVRENTLAAFTNRDFQYEELVEKTGGRRDSSRSPLFGTMFISQNVDMPEFAVSSLTVKPFPTENRTAKFDLTLTCTEVRDTISCALEYCTKLFKEETIHRFAEYLKQIISVVVEDPDKPIAQIEMLPEDEMQQLLFDFNDTEETFPTGSTIYELFEKQVDAIPDHPALEFKDKVVSFRHFDERANQLANYLRREKGLATGGRVMVSMERSLELIIALMGVMKAGGAYVPLDPHLPAERLRIVLSDASIRIVISQQQFMNKFTQLQEICENFHSLLCMGDPQNGIGNAPVERPGITGTENPAYAMYTSGSSGVPKGVLVEHQTIVNTLIWRKNYYEYAPGDVSLQIPSYFFDSSVTDIFTPLLGGARLVLVPENQRANLVKLKDVLPAKKVTHFIAVPAFYNVMLEEIPDSLKGVKKICCAGEHFPDELIRKHFEKLPHVGIVNEYGPTENSVNTTAYELKQDSSKALIGVPISNVQVTVRDRYMNLCPIGVGGEMCLSGASLARGYLNRPELTAEKFVYLNRSYKAYRTYKTGDMARWLPDGNIEFLGRLDNQVKIRGIRVEVEEIENHIMKRDDVKETVVMARQDSLHGGERYLCAYVVPSNGGLDAELKSYLAQRLPEYMVPSHIVEMDAVPFTSTGKIDRKSLPAPGIETGEFTAPRNEIEKTLVQVWEAVLGREQVGITDNFFSIGGDSIKSIRIMSRISSAGYKLELKDIFQFPTISELSPHIKRLQRITDQSPVIGPVPLTPIQESFFNNSPIDPHHYNQAVLLYSAEGFDKEIIEKVFGKLQEHHDALRMTYHADPGTGEVRQTVQDTDIPVFLQEFDAGVNLTQKINKIQKSIDLETGPLMKLGLFHLEDGDRLLIVVHHLVIDGISWRILFEDIEMLYRQIENSEETKLPLKSDSFKLWSESLQEYANHKSLLKEIGYWSQLETQPAPRIPADLDREDNLAEDTRNISFILEETETGLLLNNVNRWFNTEINDILLTALGLATRDTFGHDLVSIVLEGHGRENIHKTIDISRTVGWFTTEYPVLLDMSHTEDTGRQIKEVKETLRKVPNKGIGYGILKYLCKETIGFNLKPQIIFNYLGQFDADVNDSTLFEMAKEPAGNTRSLRQQREYELEFNGMTANNRLSMTLTYNGTHFNRETMDTLSGRFRSQLKHIIGFCSSKDTVERTPSDFTYKGLTIDRLQLLLDAYPDMDDIYPLSPMQEGMLFHALVDEHSDAYFEQTAFRLQGQLDIGMVKKSLDKLFQRHDILRTAFVHKDVPRPLQLVLKNRSVDFYFEDISHITGSKEKENICKEFKAKDKKRSFDLSSGVLGRVSILQLDASSFEFIWSFHHILMDGWCIGIINSEFFEIYNANLRGDTFRLPDVKPYRSYIQWLEKQDKEQSARYWESYLEDFDEQTGIPKTKIKEHQPSYKNERISFSLTGDETKILDKLASRHNVTLNTVTQAAWGILLGKYNHREEVVFGSVVSGRPSDLEGVESMVGLFINTIPVRICFENDMKFRNLLQNVQREYLDGEPYHYHPLADIQSRSPLKQDLIDHIFIFENYPVTQQIEGYGSDAGNKTDDNAGPSLQLSNADVFEQTNYDFNIIIAATSRLTVIFQYNAHVMDHDYVNRVASHFRLVLDQVMDKNHVEIGAITMLSREEKQRILDEFNNTGTVPPAAKTIHQLFEEQAVKFSGRCSAVSDQYYITYGELDRRSGQLADMLREKGTGPETIVAIKAERSIELITGMLGILKAGGAYLPIDPDHPQERIDYMLKDSNAKLLLSADIEIGEHKVHPYENREAGAWRRGEPCVHPNSLAYIIYTSGSTGRPKGVMVQHGTVVNMVRNHREIFGEDSNSRMSQVASISFDAAAFEIWPCLSAGAALCIAGDMARLDPELTMQWLVRQGVTISFQPTQMAMQLLDVQWPEGTALNALRTAGDRLAVYPQRAYPFRLYNLYGPTEDTVWTTWMEVPANPEGIHHLPSPAIGRPVPGKQVYILDSRQNLQPVGIAGELCVSGGGLARGYLNRPELTAASFVYFFRSNKPFRTYKTGDLARWLPDGNIEFLGRIDQQVKIRGFRIELGEIESHLVKHPAVKEAVVTAREDGNRKYLCAYFTSQPQEPGENTGTLHLKEYLAETLPDYMVPACYVELKSLPLNNSGKINRRKLPRPQDTAFHSQGAYQAPATKIQHIIADTWKEVLGREKIGIKDNFFDLGGNSLDLISVSNKLKSRLNMDIPVVTLFTYPSIGSLEKHLGGENGQDLPVRVEEIKQYTGGAVQTGPEIAIIGMTGRFPGASNIDTFWENLVNGVESVTDFSREELIEQGNRSSTVDLPNYVKAKAYLDDLQYFDATFFDYTPREAELMDPQIRLFHQCAWHAIEDAGYDPDSYDGRIGVYAGFTPNLNWKLGHALKMVNSSEIFELESLNSFSLATLICYKLNLKGPGITVNTACSSSLVAIHTASRALLNGDADMALAGGVAVTLPQKSGYPYQEGIVKSPDGRCRPFDAAARGTASGNGAAIVVLKPLQKAVLDEDHIYAVIKGTAINNDGKRKPGYTAPSVEAQVEVIMEAQKTAGTPPDTISFVETHGTATPLGDPIEFEALKTAFRENGKKKYCRLGAVKANIGHLDNAAGAAGLIKAALVLKHRVIPPAINFDTPNPEIDLENSPFYINKTLEQWLPGNLPGDPPLRAGVSSFGIGGTNAHAVLEEWRPHQTAADLRQPPSTREFQLLLVSARTPPALQQMNRNLAVHLQQHSGPGPQLADIAYTLMMGRKTFEYRQAIVCRDTTEAVRFLEENAEGKNRTHHAEIEERPVVFMFPGLGSQYTGMGIDLYQGEPIFRENMDRCFAFLKPLLGFDIKEWLYPENPGGRTGRNTGNIIKHDFETAQAVTFCVEYSLAQVMMGWGVKPYAAIGYSFGEYVAACTAGVFSLEDALALVTARGKLIKRLPPGSMLSVPADAETVQSFLDDRLAIAIDNGGSCVVAGPNDAIDSFEKQMKEKRLICIRPEASHALHTRMMQPIAHEFENRVARVTLNEPRTPFISNVTGKWMAPKDAVNPRYWAAHLEETVRFADGLKELMSIWDAVFLEIGPGVSMTTLAHQYTRKELNQRVLNLVRAPEQKINDTAYLLKKTGMLWQYGTEIDWATVHAGENRKRVPLPLYPFDKLEYSIDDPLLKLVDLINETGGMVPQPPPPTVPTQTGMEKKTPYTPPANKEEQLLVQLWEEILGIGSIGIHDNLLEMGVTSLKAITFTGKLKQKLGITIHTTEIFDEPTVAEQAAYFQTHYPRAVDSITDREPFAGQHINAGSAKAGDLRKLNSGPDTGAHFFFIHEVSGEAVLYSELAWLLKSRFQCYGLQAARLPGCAPQNLTIEELAAKYIRTIKNVQPHGPYHLAGWSYAGNIMLEMALQLEQFSNDPALLAFIDCDGPYCHFIGDPTLYPNGAEPVTLEMEKRLIEAILPGSGIKCGLSDINNVNRLWSTVIDYLKSNTEEMEKINKLLAGDDFFNVLQALNHGQMSIEDAIHYFNLGRTLMNAAGRYIPGTKLRTPIHLFEATRGREGKNIPKLWQDHCTAPVTYHKLDTTHYSILQPPQVSELARLLIKVSEEINTDKNRR